MERFNKKTVLSLRNLVFSAVGEKRTMPSLGRHIVADFFGCKADLNAGEWIADVLYEAARACSATVLERSNYHFSPYGVTCIVLISESHLAIHTWPEFNYAAVDLFTCGKHVDPRKALAVLEKKLAPTKTDIKQMPRGDYANLPEEKRRMIVDAEKEQDLLALNVKEVEKK